MLILTRAVCQRGRPPGKGNAEFDALCQARPRIDLDGIFAGALERMPAGLAPAERAMRLDLTHVLPAWWGTYGWFFGVAIGGSVYFVLATLRPRPVLARA